MNSTFVPGGSAFTIATRLPEIFVSPHSAHSAFADEVDRVVDREGELDDRAAVEAALLDARHRQVERHVERKVTEAEARVERDAAGSADRDERGVIREVGRAPAPRRATPRRSKELRREKDPLHKATGRRRSRGTPGTRRYLRDVQPASRSMVRVGPAPTYPPRTARSV